MKKAGQFMKLLNVNIILYIGIMALTISCSKQNDPEPSNTKTTPIVPTTPPEVSSDNPICEDSICKVPFRIMSVFLPSGYWDGADQGVELLIDSVGESMAYAGEGLRIRYTKGEQWGWGASFLNNNNWDGAFKITPSATKITFYAKVDYSANVTFNAFGNDANGKIELYEKASPVTPAWEKITIDLLNKPTTFSAPLSVVIDGDIPEGHVTIVDIKDLLFE